MEKGKLDQVIHEPESILKSLHIDMKNRLIDREAASRLNIYGHNELPVSKKTGISHLFIEQVNYFTLKS